VEKCQNLDMTLGEVLLNVTKVCLSLGDGRILGMLVGKGSQENGLLIIYHGR